MDEPRRPAPLVTPHNEFFWRGGADGKLRFKRCQQCHYYIHPPVPYCRNCLSKDIAIQEVSGRATVGAFTINHHPWHPAFDPPYAIAIVQIEEAEYVHYTTNIVNCPPEQVHVGMEVQVAFVQAQDTYLPVFEPRR
jgi:uncharacterized OB-fold protein